MILRSLTCFSLVAALAGASSVQGTIAITDVKGKKHGVSDLSGIIVWLEPAPGTPVALHRPPVKSVMVQKNKTFTPHVLAIPVGTSVEFPNFDPIFHNAFSNYNGQLFDVGLYPPGSSRSVTFRRPGIVRVFCNIHSSMSAVIVVLSTPFYATSKPDGSFEIEDVPEGTYQMNFYYERATEQMLDSQSRTLQVSEAVQSVGTVTISESGYLPIPHLNKYGRPYEKGPDALSYPGARQ